MQKTLIAICCLFVSSVFSSSISTAQSSKPSADGSALSVNPVAMQDFGYWNDAAKRITWRVCDLGTKWSGSINRCEGVPVKATWVQAVELVLELNRGRFEGYDDWRLPTSEDLQILLRDDVRIARIKEPVRRGSASAFGGYFLNFADGACKVANEKIYETLGKFNGLRDDFFSSHRWLADNPDKEGLQNPLAISYVSSFGMHSHGGCNVLTFAFLEDQFDSKRQGELRLHATQPVTIVRGGDGGEFWDLAKSSIERREEITASSKAAGRAATAALARTVEGVTNYVREVLSTPVEPNSSMSSASTASASPRSTGSGSRSYVCEYKCTNAKFTGADKSSMKIRVRAASKSAAEDETIRHGKATCYQQTSRVWDTGSQRCREE